MIEPPIPSEPRLRDWFAARRWSPFPFQAETRRTHVAGGEGLVHAPTGTGKTLAVWGGPLLDWMARHPGAGPDDGAAPLEVLWLTPLRALAGDTEAALTEPVRGLGVPWTIERRTGDTSSSVRARQKRTLPTALITTPESLSVLLSYAGARQRFRTLRAVIIDEWHELMGTKRGVQAELGVAALRACAPGLRVWGLSATLGNLEQAMTTLLGNRPGRLVQDDSTKTIEIETILPDDVERFPWAGHLGTRLLPDVIAAIDRAGSTLIFTNTRSQAESWFHALLRAAPRLVGSIALHHGSLDRGIRAEVEGMLRDGRLRAVVCTSSLDLGVDFTPVDQVIQVGSPKGIARLLQCAGRSGHQPGAVSRIVGVPTNALEIIEFAAARDALARREIESRPPLDRPLDVLVQHLVTRALGDRLAPQELRREAASTHAFANLDDDDWRWCMDFVRRGGPALVAYPQYARMTTEEGLCRVPSRQVAMRHRMSIGTITSDAAMTVRFRGGRTLGTIEESFIARLSPGDTFIFAGRPVELVRVRDMTAQVQRARSSRGVVPRWIGGRSPLSSRLADAVSRQLDLARRGRLRGPEAASVRPLLDLQAAWSVIPAPGELLIECARTRDGHHVFLFSLAGRLVHEGLGALLAHRITRRTPISVTSSGNDYGIELLAPDPLPTDAGTWRELLSIDGLLDDLLACLNSTELTRRRFREIARIAGLIFQGFPGQRVNSRHLQASSELFYEVFTEFDPGNRLLDQARREVLERELESSRLRRTLDRLAASELVIRHPDSLTPLSFPIWADRLRSQHVSSETWRQRVERMVDELESRATPGRARGRGTRAGDRVVR